MSTKKKPSTTKASTTKAATKDLGKAPTTKRARKPKPPLDEGFTQQREDDAKDAKLGAAAKHVKECHLLAKECTTRLATARMQTSTQEAIEHDLNRVLELVDDIKTTAQDAREALVL